jgi:RecB family endonuclease NucS
MDVADVNSTHHFIKDPYVLEFLNLPNNLTHKEKDIENAIIKHLKHFLLELGKGFAFVAQQKLIRTETSDFYIDLVFYNYLLKCFVVIDIKNAKLTHQDVGQLDMYVRMYDDLEKTETDNPTIGILLCADTDNIVAKYSVLNDKNNLFASKYQLYLPTEKQLQEWLKNEPLNLDDNE